MVIPCKTCLTLPSCLSFLQQRKDLFIRDGESPTKNHDSESLIILYYKCSILKNFLEITDHNGKLAISKPAFYAILKFFEKHWVEGPYKGGQADWYIFPVETASR